MDGLDDIITLLTILTVIHKHDSLDRKRFRGILVPEENKTGEESSTRSVGHQTLNTQGESTTVKTAGEATN